MINRSINNFLPLKKSEIDRGSIFQWNNRSKIDWKKICIKKSIKTKNQWLPSTNLEYIITNSLPSVYTVKYRCPILHNTFKYKGWKIMWRNILLNSGPSTSKAVPGLALFSLFHHIACATYPYSLCNRPDSLCNQHQIACATNHIACATWRHTL